MLSGQESRSLEEGYLKVVLPFRTNDFDTPFLSIYSLCIPISHICTSHILIPHIRTYRIQKRRRSMTPKQVCAAQVENAKVYSATPDALKKKKKEKKARPICISSEGCDDRPINGVYFISLQNRSDPARGSCPKHAMRNRFGW